MNKKKILIVSRAFYPIIAPRSFRATELAKEFAKQGHEVTVLTHRHNFDYSEFSKMYNLKIEDFVENKWKGIKGNNILIKGLRFLLNYFFLFPDIQLTFFLQKALKNRWGYDLLISIAIPYPVHWGVALAKKRNTNLCKVWIADCGDPFMGNKELKFRYPFYFKFIENWFCKKPDFLTVPIKEAIDAYPESCKNKIRVIPQGFNFSNNFINKGNIKNQYSTFAYAGLLSKGIRDPEFFLKYLCKIKESKFKFIVYTKNIALLESFRGELAEKLEIRDYIPREQLLKELGKMDFLINFENQNNVQVPSKLIDYVLTGRPILSIKQNNFNFKVFEEFLAGNYSNKYIIKDIEKYNIKNVVAQFLSLFT